MISAQPAELWSFVTTMTDFGARFTRAREGLGLSLDQIATETRISTRFLRAIEKEEFQILPGGIFNRGFIRTYAQRLGLDPNQAVADYERIFTPTVPEPLASVVKEVQDAPPPDAAVARRGRDYYPVAVAALIVLIAVFYVLNRNSSTSEYIPSSLNSAEVVEPAEPAADSPAVTQAVAVPEQTPVPQPAALATPAVVQQPVQAEPPPSAAVAASALVLELEASSVTWIRLSADGIVVEDVILQPGHARRYTAMDSLEISIGNAGGISMKVNGRDVGSLGVEGRARKFLITPDNASTIRG
jgi:cytoskeletal protein RodZ